MSSFNWRAFLLAFRTNKTPIISQLLIISNSKIILKAAIRTTQLWRESASFFYKLATFVSVCYLVLVVSFFSLLPIQLLHDFSTSSLLFLYTSNSNEWGREEKKSIQTNQFENISAELTQSGIRKNKRQTTTKKLAHRIEE